MRGSREVSQGGLSGLIWPVARPARICARMAQDDLGVSGLPEGGKVNLYEELRGS